MFYGHLYLIYCRWAFIRLNDQLGKFDTTIQPRQGCTSELAEVPIAKFLPRIINGLSR